MQALEKAFSSNPSAIVVITPRIVDDSFAKTVLEARKNYPTKVYCISIGEPESSKAMQATADLTGGFYKLVSMEELQSVRR